MIILIKMMTFWYKFGTIMVYVKNRKKVYDDK